VSILSYLKIEKIRRTNRQKKHKHKIIQYFSKRRPIQTIHLQFIP